MLSIFSSIQNKENRSRLETLYKEHASSMYQVAYAILNDKHIAQDAVQEAFINIFNNFEKISTSDNTKIKALFVIIVRHVSIDIYRQKKKQYSITIGEIEDNFFDLGSIVEEILIKNETFNKVAEMIKKLHPSYADILSLKFFYHYEDEEISQILNISPTNVRTRLHRARKSLIKLLSQEQEVTNHE